MRNFGGTYERKEREWKQKEEAQRLFSETWVDGVVQYFVEVYDEAIAALTMLGFAQAPSQKVVTTILKEEPGLTVEKVIKLALKRL